MRLVDAEHAVEHALVREIDAQLLGIHVVFLLLQLVAEVAPVPDVDLRVRVAGFLDLDLAELGQLGVELGLQAGLELLQEINGRGGVLDHLDFGLVIGPGLVAELVGDVVAQRQDLFEQRDVRPRGPGCRAR